MKKWKGYIDSITVREVNDRIRFLERALLVERASAILTFDSSPACSPMRHCSPSNSGRVSGRCWST